MASDGGGAAWRASGRRAQSWQKMVGGAVVEGEGKLNQRISVEPYHLPGTPPMNIWHQTDEYMGPVKVKLDGPYIRWFLAETDEYNFIFVGTVEFKKLTNEWYFPIVSSISIFKNILCNILNL
jgi:hypothetical protein